MYCCDTPLDFCCVLSVYLSVFAFIFLCWIPHCQVSYFHNKINSASDTHDLFKTFNSLLCPPPAPPTSCLTADDFATFFTNKTRGSVASSQLHTRMNSNQLHLLIKLPSSPSVPSQRGCIQTSPLHPSYNMSSRSNTITPSLPSR